MRLLLPVFVLLCALGCDAGITVLNVSPEVTAVGPIALEGEQVSILFWVRDHEEDPVDLNLELIRTGKEPQLMDALGGHGPIGLTTDRDPGGRAHLVFWVPGDDVDINETIQLRLSVIDSEGALSADFDTVPFTLVEGLPAP